MKLPTPPGSTLERLLDGPVRPGRLVWIGLRPARQSPMIIAEAAALVAARGLDGDHYETRRDGARQVTIIAREDIAAIASFLGRDGVDPALLRRNLVTEGINVMALKGRRFRIGEALCEGSGECAPCSRMETALGPGGYSAVRGHGGITARVIEGATVRIGDVVTVALEKI